MKQFYIAGFNGITKFGISNGNASDRIKLHERDARKMGNKLIFEHIEDYENNLVLEGEIKKLSSMIGYKYTGEWINVPYDVIISLTNIAKWNIENMKQTNPLEQYFSNPEEHKDKTVKTLIREFTNKHYKIKKEILVDYIKDNSIGYIFISKNKEVFTLEQFITDDELNDMFVDFIRNNKERFKSNRGTTPTSKSISSIAKIINMFLDESNLSIYDMTYAKSNLKDTIKNMAKRHDCLKMDPNSTLIII